jgi:hypothetical protein
MRVLVMALVVASTAFGLAGCGRTALDSRGAEADAGIVPAKGTSSDFLDTFPRAWCQYQVTCRLSPSVEQCLLDHFDSGQPFRIEVSRAIDSGRFVYNPAKGALCAKAFATAPCSLAGAAPGSPIVVACAGMLEGTVPPGGDCVYSDECTSHNCITRACGDTCCLGSCADSSDVGASCTDPTACFPDNYCAAGQAPTTNGPTPGTGTCQRFLGLGESCGTKLCQRGLACDPRTGTCAAPVKDGQPCWPDGARCDNQGSFCNGAPGVCQPAGGPGASCFFPSSATQSCVFYAYCRRSSSDPSTGVCVPRPGVGEPCTSSSPPVYCSCTGGICQYPPTPPCTIETATR